METEVRAIGKVREAVEEATDVRTAVGRTDILANCNLAYLKLNPKAMVVINDIEILSDLFDSIGNISHVIPPVSEERVINHNMEVTEGRC